MVEQIVLQKPREGSLYEKYVGELFELSGCEVKYNQRFVGDDVSHEIDIVVKIVDKYIFIECKNVDPPFKKSLVDAYIGKLTDLQGRYSALGFFVHLKGGNGKDFILKKYKDYCNRKNIVFLDEENIFEIKSKVGKLQTNIEKQSYLANLFHLKRESKATSPTNAIDVDLKDSKYFFSYLLFFLSVIFILMGSALTFFVAIVLCIVGSLNFYYTKNNRFPQGLDRIMNELKKK